MSSIQEPGHGGMIDNIKNFFSSKTEKTKQGRAKKLSPQEGVQQKANGIMQRMQANFGRLSSDFKTMDRSTLIKNAKDETFTKLSDDVESTVGEVKEQKSLLQAKMKRVQNSNSIFTTKKGKAKKLEGLDQSIKSLEQTEQQMVSVQSDLRGFAAIAKSVDKAERPDTKLEEAQFLAQHGVPLDVAKLGFAGYVDLALTKPEEELPRLLLMAKGMTVDQRNRAFVPLLKQIKAELASQTPPLKNLAELVKNLPDDPKQAEKQVGRLLLLHSLMTPEMKDRFYKDLATMDIEPTKCLQLATTIVKLGDSQSNREITLGILKNDIADAKIADYLRGEKLGSRLNKQFCDSEMKEAMQGEINVIVSSLKGVQCEVDPAKEKDKEQLGKNEAMLKQKTQEAFDKIHDVVTDTSRKPPLITPETREYFAGLYKTILEDAKSKQNDLPLVKTSEKDETPRRMTPEEFAQDKVTNIFFLRFASPILATSQVGLATDDARNVSLVSKAIQNIANQVTKLEKEEFMAFSIGMAQDPNNQAKLVDVFHALTGNPRG